MFRSTLKRMAKAQRMPMAQQMPKAQQMSMAQQMPKAPRLTIHNNPYKAQKNWPPDFSKLSPKYQFRLEKRYRRRAKLRYLPPGWVKGVKIASIVIPFAVFVFAVFIMDWGDMPGIDGKPFEGTREWVRKQSSSIWTVRRPTLESDAPERDTPPKPPS